MADPSTRDVTSAADDDIAFVYSTKRDLSLIAAAPELLAACKKKLTAQMLHETALAHELYTARDSAMQAAEEAGFEADEFMRAAIAKAEGK